MGNCFAACSQQKQSVPEIPPIVGEESKNLSKNQSLKSARVPKLRRNKSASATIPRVWSRGGRNNRVSPCDDGSTGNPGGINTSREGSNNWSRARQPSDSSGSPESYVGTLSSSTIFEEYLSGGCCQPFDENPKSRTPTPFIQPGITKGRLIIVQPCRSMSSTSYEETSPDNVPCVSAAKMPINEESETVQSCGICISESSIGSSTDDPLDIELDGQSEEESCQVFPHPGI